MKKMIVYDVFKTIISSLKTSPITTTVLLLISVFLGFIPRISLFLIEKLQLFLYSPEEKVLWIVFCIIGLWGSLFFIEQVLGELRVYFSMIVQTKLRKDFSEKLINKLMILPTEKHDDPEFQTVVSRVAKLINGGALWNYILTVFFLPVNIISTFSMISYISRNNILSLVLLSLSIVCQFLWLFVSKREEVDTEIKLEDSNRKASYYYNTFWNKNETRDIRLFRFGDFMKQKWIKTIFESYNTHKALRRKYLFLFIGVFLLLCISLILSIKPNQFIESPELIVSTLMGYIYFLNALTLSIESISDLFSSEIHLNELFSIINMDTELVEVNDYEEQVDKDILISLRNVSFSYPATKNIEVLKNINLDIKKNEVLAIVGANGSGKSTLVKILLGLFSPTSGSIRFDSDFINKRDRFSAEFQNYIKYEYTLNDNIGLGDDVLFQNADMVKKAIDRTEINDLIQSLPEKENQRLGKHFEGGIDLSGGQWQRIGLARACLRDALLIALDEPTASLDPNAEAKIFELFLKNHNENSVLLIAHRIGPARMADRIIVIDKGEIVESGTHNELLSRNGVYSRLYEAQAKWYTANKVVE